MEDSHCPECNTILPVNPEFVTWCHVCDWNLNPLKPDKPQNLFESAYVKLGQRQSDYLFARLQRANSLTPRLTLSRFLAILFALGIHLLTISLLGLGLILLSNEFRNICTFIPAITCFVLAWELRPRFAKMPPFLPRDAHPHLYAFVDDMADTLGAKRITGIRIDDAYSASIMSVTWRRQQILTIGLPLWTVLTREERAALVGHELAHSVNGDPTRTLVVGTALGSLIRWYLALHPRELGYGCLMSISNALLALLAQLPRLGISVLAHLVYRDSQRAEYLADYKAATVAGTAAAVTLLEKLYFAGTYNSIRNRATAVQNTEIDFFQELTNRVVQIPEREIERIRRVQKMEGSRLDVTHPPTPYRIEMLYAHFVSQPLLDIARYDQGQMDEELRAIKEDMRLKLNSGGQYYFLKLAQARNST